MTDSHLMAADCIHGVVWFECAECAKDDPRPPDEPPFISRLVAWWRGWWKRNIIDDAAPYTDDEAERWKRRDR